MHPTDLHALHWVGKQLGPADASLEQTPQPLNGRLSGPAQGLVCRSWPQAAMQHRLGRA